ncbi:MAG: TRIC cation channel family protein [Chloroflexota bacterium]
MDLQATSFTVLFVVDLIATAAWATSGAIVARARGFDYLGVMFIAVIASTGGSLIRDGIFSIGHRYW